MATIVLRQTKGAPLSVTEVDGNFQGLNDALGAAGSSTIPTPSGTGSPVLTNGATLTGNVTVSGTLSNTSNTALKLPAGSTAQRPAGVQGQVRYNITTSFFEGYSGSAWISLIQDGTTVTVGQGGTGATTLTANSVLLGNGTSALQSVAPGATAGYVLTSNGTTWVSSPPAITLPSQTGFSGKVLTTNGTAASWNSSLSGIKLGAYQESVVNITASTATTTVDLSAGSVFNITIAANTAIVFTNFPAGADLTSFTIITVNDATAGRALSWPASMAWAGGVLPPRTTAASASDAWALFTLNAGTKVVGSLSIANF